MLLRTPMARDLVPASVAREYPAAYYQIDKGTILVVSHMFNESYLKHDSLLAPLARLDDVWQRQADGTWSKVGHGGKA